MKFLSKLLFLTLVLHSSCGKPFPTFNPFDDVFQVDTEKIIHNESLYVEGDGGYMMHSKNMGDYYVYYSIFAGKQETVLSKGLFIPLDTISIRSKQVPLLIIDGHAKATFLGERKVDTGRVDSTFSIYGFERVRTRGENWFYEDKLGREITVSRHWWYHWKGKRLKIIRKMFYTNRAPEEELRPDTTRQKSFFSS